MKIEYEQESQGETTHGILKRYIPAASADIIRIQVNEGGIEKFLPRITDWHHEACRVFFLSHHHTNNRFFFLLTTKYLILYWKT